MSGKFLPISLVYSVLGITIPKSLTGLLWSHRALEGVSTIQGDGIVSFPDPLRVIILGTRQHAGREEMRCVSV